MDIIQNKSPIETTTMAMLTIAREFPNMIVDFFEVV
jgi:hypothetical protein